jgi:carboxymethylenebutenolidase
MCYPDDARPPDHGRGGDVASHRDLELTAADGNRFAAYSTRAASPTGAGMVVLPDVRGLHNFYRSMACRLAEGGMDAVAIDYFGRTAGIGDRSEAFEYPPHVEKTTMEGIAADTAAAVDFLRSPDGGAVERVFTVGFCFGGANSWAQSALQPGLAGAIGFYGRPERVRDLVPEMKAPLLLLVAGADHTPMSEFTDLDHRLDEAGVPHRMVVFDGAPHSFFDRGYDTFKDECRRAWDEIFAFVESPPA